MSQENTEDNSLKNLRETIRRGFENYAKAITEMQEFIRTLNNKMDDVVKRIEVLEKQSPSESIEKLQSIIMDNSMMLMPLTEMAHFAFQFDQMINGTNQQTPDAIVDILLQEYGIRMSKAFLDCVRRAVKSTNRPISIQKINEIQERIKKSDKAYQAKLYKQRKRKRDKQQKLAEQSNEQTEDDGSQNDDDLTPMLDDSADEDAENEDGDQDGDADEESDDPDADFVDEDDE